VFIIDLFINLTETGFSLSASGPLAKLVYLALDIIVTKKCKILVIVVGLIYKSLHVG
jgi:hypothetical protein